MRALRAAVGVVVAGLVLAGCTDGGDAGPPPTTRSTTTTTTAATTTTTNPASRVVLGPDGLGVARFGDPEAAAVAALTEALGAPDGAGRGCELAGDTVTTRTFKELSVQFADGRFDAWSVVPKPGVPLAFGLRTADGLEIGATRDELDAIYGERITIPGAFDDPQSFRVDFPGSEGKIVGMLSGTSVHSTVDRLFTQLCE